MRINTRTQLGSCSCTSETTITFLARSPTGCRSEPPRNCFQTQMNSMDSKSPPKTKTIVSVYQRINTLLYLGFYHVKRSARLSSTMKRLCSLLGHSIRKPLVQLLWKTRIYPKSSLLTLLR